MEFLLSKSQIEIQKAARDFAKGEFDKDLATKMDKQHLFPETIFKKAAELGFIGLHLDEKYQGGGLDIFEDVLLAEELCRRDSTIGTALMLAAFGSECLLRFGNEELKRQYLPQIAEGTILSSIAISENNGNCYSNPIKTNAVKNKDHWLINGYKTNVINGGAAGFYCVLCNTQSGEHQDKNLSMFLVEAGRSGVTPVETGDKLGLRMTPLSDMRFENVRIPVSNLIGKEGDGLVQAEAFYDENRILMAAIAIGIGQGSLDKAIDYIKNREQFGKKIAQFQITQHKIAEMANKMEQARILTYMAAQSFNHKKSNPALPAMAKLAASKAALETTYEAIQLFGGYGYTTEYEAERYYRDAKCIEILTEKISSLKDLVAGHVIGKIR